MPATRCPACGAAGVHFWNEKLGYSIERCDECGHGFVNPRPALEVLAEFYAVSGHEGTARHEGESLDEMIARHTEGHESSRYLVEKVGKLAGKTEGARLLDVGCGYGLFTLDALNQGFEVEAIEFATEEREIAERIVPGLSPQAVFFEDFEGAGYDAILMSQVLEHAQDVNLWISKAFGILNPSGVLAVALPNFEGVFRKVRGVEDPYICPPAHLNFFTKRSLACLLERHGLEVRDSSQRSRIPIDSLRRRLPAPLVPVAEVMAQAACKLCDMAGVGIMLNVFATKPTG